MPLPPSFLKAGFRPASESRSKRYLPGLKRPGIMIGTEGETNTGKTEFILSCPGPGIVLAVDRGYDSMLDNPNPPASRRDDFAFDEIKLSTAAMAEDHKANWKNFYERYLEALRNPDARTVGIDGDSDTWETQRLAEFGRITQVPPIMYTGVRASRKAMYYRAYDSGKIIVATNKLKPEYVAKMDDNGLPIMKDGKEVREKSGELTRQGFDDDSYLFSIQLRHLYHPPHASKATGRMSPQQWGMRVLKCKPNPELIGQELWGDDCNFATLIQLAYPQVPLHEWGIRENV